MADVVIHRCTVRVLRHGGWSWGPQPRRLVDDVMRSLPGLLEAELAGLDEPKGDRVLAAPVRVVVPVRGAELAVRGGAVLTGELEQRLRVAVRSAALATPELRAGRRAGEDLRRQVGAGTSSAAAGERPTPLSVLARWLAEGRLETLLEHLPPAALASWDRWVFANAGPDGGRPERAVRAAREVVAGLRTRAWGDGETTFVLRARLRAAAAVARLALDAPAALAEIARLVPLPDVDTAVRAASTGAAAARLPPPAALEPVAVVSAGAPLADVEPAPPASRALPRSRGEAPVAALPFLALAVLARLGYTAAAAAALAAEELDARLPAFAQGLALKLLEPPGHGWRHGARSVDTAAAVAGLTTPAPPAELLGLARAAPRFAGVLDAVVAALLLEEPRRRPLLVHRAARGDLVLVDPVGWFLVTSAEDIGAIVELLTASSRKRVRLSAAAESRELRRALQDAGIEAPRLGRPAEAERVDALLEAFGARPAVPRGGGPALERSLELAAALGLGTIAYALWSADDPDPLLTLERFGDLDAHASFEPHRIRVRLPLGRRHRELEANGLLADVHDLPWLGGRTLEFAGG